jgi:hypothetical protein
LRVAAGFAIGGLALQALLQVPSFVLTVKLMYTLRNEAPSDDPVLVALGGVVVLNIALFVGTAAAFMRWLYLALTNLHGWRIPGLSHGPGWAIGAWFIPLANVVIPVKVMSTVARGSSVPADGRYPEATGVDLVAWWWTFFVLSQVVTVATFRDLFVGSVGYVYGVTGLNHVLTFIAAVLAIVLVVRITRRQAARHKALITARGSAASDPTA